MEMVSLWTIVVEKDSKHWTGTKLQGHRISHLKWLTRMFGLSLLSAEDVPDAFAMDIMNDAPSDPKCQ